MNDGETAPAVGTWFQIWGAKTPGCVAETRRFSSVGAGTDTCIYGFSLLSNVCNVACDQRSEAGRIAGSTPPVH